MAVIKVIRNTYGGVNYIRNLCKYIHESPYMKLCGGYGVCADDPEKAADEMINVRRFFHKESGNPLFHIIVAFDDTVKDEGVAWEYIVKTASFFLFDYQVYFGMHSKDEETPHLHGHLAVNSVNYRNGSMMVTDIIIPLLKARIENITGQDCTVVYEDKKNS